MRRTKTPKVLQFVTRRTIVFIVYYKKKQNIQIIHGTQNYQISELFSIALVIVIVIVSEFLILILIGSFEVFIKF